MQIDQKDAQITAEQIGDEIGLSHSGVVRRLRRLRDNAVIVADVSLVSAEAAGYPVRVNVSCSIERDRPDTYERFIEALRSDAMVVSAAGFVTATVVGRNDGRIG